MLSTLLICVAAFSPVVQEANVQATSAQAESMSALDQARVAMLEKRWADAHKLLHTAKKQDKKNPEVYLLLGDLNAALNKPSMAKSNYKKAQKLGGDATERLAKL